MSIINTLHTLLKQSLPSLHAARLNALMAAVGAGLTGAPVSITALVPPIQVKLGLGGVQNTSAQAAAQAA